MKQEQIRKANKKERQKIKEMEQMLSQEKKLPPTYQMARNLAVDIWRNFAGMVK